MPERQCNGCTRQKEWGCTAYSYPLKKGDDGARPDGKGGWVGWVNPAFLPVKIDGEDTYACPRQDLKARPMQWHQMFLYYGFYKSGHLPQIGSVMDQSNKAAELFRIIDAVNAECDNAGNEDAKRKAAAEAAIPKARPRL